MSSAEKSGKGRKVSVWNWLGTLILLGIPGVNLIALILFIIFSKAPAKRSFCIAALILMLLGFALVCAAFLILPDQLAQLAQALREAAYDSMVSLPSQRKRARPPRRSGRPRACHFPRREGRRGIRTAAPPRPDRSPR